MKVTLDGIQYDLDLSKPIELYRLMWRQLSTGGIKTADGSTFVFNKDSLLRTALKTVMTPVVIPAIKRLYQKKGIELEPPVKHSDLLDYAVNKMLDYMTTVQGDVHAYLTSQANENSGRTIVGFSTIASTNADSAIQQPTTPGTENTRRKALVHSGQDRNGEDDSSKGDNREESELATASQHLSP